MIMRAISELRRSTLSGSIIYVGPDFSDACLRRMDGDQSRRS